MIDAKHVMRACTKSFTAIGAFSLFINLLMLSVPLYTLQLFDRVLTSQNVETLILLSVAVGIALLLLGFLEVMRSRVMVRVSIWIDRVLGPELLACGIRNAPLINHKDSLQTLRDLSALRGFISGTGVFHLFDSPWVPIYVAVIFAMHPLLGFIALFGAILLGILAWINELATRKALADANRLAIKVQNSAESHARNAEVIEAMGMLPRLVEQWRKQSSIVLSLQSIASDRAGLLAGLTKMLRFTIQVTIMGVGVSLAIQQKITPGVMIAASIILGRALAPVEQMIGTWKGFVAAREAYKRIHLRLSLPSIERGATQLPTPEGQIIADRVTFIPPGGETPSLQGVSFHLEPGEILGVIGPSAAGKSSLARLLVGVWEPRLGHIRLDGADIYQWERENFGRHVGYVPQDVELFGGTVKQNIARMDPNPDDADVIQAAQLAESHNMILRLPHGYDTQIGEGGQSLSAGQRQRVALARALYGDIKLLILDEPNANLDTAGDRALMNAMRHAKERKITTVIIAHRPSILAEVDKLLVLNEGKVALFGPRAEVMAKLNNSNKVTQLPSKTAHG